MLLRIWWGFLRHHNFNYIQLMCIALPVKKISNMSQLLHKNAHGSRRIRKRKSNRWNWNLMRASFSFSFFFFNHQIRLRLLFIQPCTYGVPSILERTHDTRMNNEINQTSVEEIRVWWNWCWSACVCTTYIDAKSRRTYISMWVCIRAGACRWNFSSDGTMAKN